MRIKLKISLLVFLKNNFDVDSCSTSKYHDFLNFCPVAMEITFCFHGEDLIIPSNFANNSITDIYIKDMHEFENIFTCFLQEVF